MDYEINYPLQFTGTTEKLTTETKANAEVFNKIYGLLLNNDSFLKAVCDLAAAHMESMGIHVTEKQKNAWDAKATTELATPITDGLMSAADKGKIDGAAMKNNPTFSGYLSMGRKAGSSIGTGSVAMGENVVASGTLSHAEGGGTEATAYYAHAEGYETMAKGYYTHAEGKGAKATGMYAHAEGFNTEANGGGAHAEGASTKASGAEAHAEGAYTEASGYYAHSSGYYTVAQGYAQTAIGANNRPVGTPTSYGTKDAELFVIGNGTNSVKNNALRVCGTKVYTGADGSYNASGADYGEMFEWKDGNPEGEDRIGFFVTLDGNEIRIASAEDYILGAVSGISCVIGNSDEDYRRKYKTDVFGRIQYGREEMQMEDGEKILVEAPLLLPEYDPDREYATRMERKEWDCVGMFGQLIVRDDGSCKVNGYCRAADGGVATCAEGRAADAYRVMARVDKNIIKILFR